MHRAVNRFLAAGAGTTPAAMARALTEHSARTRCALPVAARTARGLVDRRVRGGGGRLAGGDVDRRGDSAALGAADRTRYRGIALLRTLRGRGGAGTAGRHPRGQDRRPRLPPRWPSWCPTSRVSPRFQRPPERACDPDDSTPGGLVMRAVTWQGRRNVSVDTVPDPQIKEPTDAVIRSPAPTSAAPTSTSTRSSARSCRRVTSWATRPWVSSRRSAPRPVTFGSGTGWSSCSTSRADSASCATAVCKASVRQRRTVIRAPVPRCSGTPSLR